MKTNSPTHAPDARVKLPIVPPDATNTRNVREIDRRVRVGGFFPSGTSCGTEHYQLPHHAAVGQIINRSGRPAEVNPRG